MRRWAQPAQVMAVENAPNSLDHVGGRIVQDVTMRLHPETVERIRTGYMCLECLEPFETPWPEVCPLRGCGYEVRKYQADDFEKKFQGVERNPRAVLIENELDALDDRHERKFHETKTGIVVPGWINTD